MPLSTWVPAILEGDPGTVDQILDSARHEHLSCVGQGGNSCSDVDCNATDVITARLALAGVQAASNVDAQFRHAFSESGGAAKRTGRAVERGQEPVASVFYDATLEAGNFGAGDLIVPLEQFTPALVTELSGASGGIDDVGEQHRGQDAVDCVLVALTGEELLDLTGDRLDVPHPRPVVDAVEFDQPCLWDLRGQLAPVLHRDHLVSTVQDREG